SQHIDRQSALEIVRLMNAEDALVAGAGAREAPPVAAAIEAPVARLRGGGGLVYFGAGASGRLGAKAPAGGPPTFANSPELIVGCIAGGSFALTLASEEAEDSAALGETDVTHLAIAARDVVVGISASGQTPYVLGALEEARRRGASTIGLACNVGTPLQ